MKELRDLKDLTIQEATRARGARGEAVLAGRRAQGRAHAALPTFTASVRLACVRLSSL